MNRFFKNLIIFFTIFSLIVPVVLADNFKNDIKNITFNMNSIGKPEITLYLDKIQDVNIIKKDELQYVILLPETSSSFKDKVSLKNVPYIIKNVEVKTQQYVGNLKGYTKIIITTSRPVMISTKAVLASSNPPKPNASVVLDKKSNTNNVSTSKSVSNSSAKQVAKNNVSSNVATLPVNKKTSEKYTKVKLKKSENTLFSKQTKKYSKINRKNNVLNNKSLAKYSKNNISESSYTRKDKKSKISDKSLSLKKSKKYSYNEPSVKKTEKVQKVKKVEKVKVSKPTPSYEMPNETYKEPVLPSSTPEYSLSQLRNDIDNGDVQENTEPPFNQKDLIQKGYSEVLKTPEIVYPVLPSKETSDKKSKNDTVKKKSFYVSLSITGFLLILLMMLKRFNKNNKVNPEIQKEQDEIPTVEKPAENNTFYTDADTFGEDDIPYHESFSHGDESANAQEAFENLQENVNNDEQNIESNIDMDEQIDNFNEQPEQDTSFEDIMLEENQPEQEEAPDMPEKPVFTGNFESFGDDFGTESNNVSPDDVFGAFDDETNESLEDTNLNQDTSFQNDLLQDTPVDDGEAELSEQMEVENHAPVNKVSLDNPAFESLVTQNTIEQERKQEVKNTFKDDVKIDKIEKISSFDEDEKHLDKKTEDDYIKGSFDLTPTKSLYLVDYEGVSVLMASIKDEFKILKKFDRIINKPLSVRQTDKNTKKSTYLVRIGSFRGMVEVTMKNVELTLEL